MIKHFKKYMEQNGRYLHTAEDHYTIVPIGDCNRQGMIDITTESLRGYCLCVMADVGNKEIVVIDNRTRKYIYYPIKAILELFELEDIPTEKPNINLEVQNIIKDVRSSINHLEELLTKMNVKRG